jgi:hypothetical protein
MYHILLLTILGGRQDKRLETGRHVGFMGLPSDIRAKLGISLSIEVVYPILYLKVYDKFSALSKQDNVNQK